MHDRLIICNGEKDVVPGKIKGEFVKNVYAYYELFDTNWRSILSDTYLSPFELDGLRWATVEHYYQAQKYVNDKSFYNNISLNSNSLISKNVDALMSAVHGNSRYKCQTIQKAPNKSIPLNRKVDNGIVTRAVIIREKALSARFRQNRRDRKILLATNKAHLINEQKGKTMGRDKLMEKIRDKIRRKIELKRKYKNNKPRSKGITSSSISYIINWIPKINKNSNTALPLRRIKSVEF